MHENSARRAREVAVRLVELALAPAAARVADLAGPREEQLVAMVRSYVRAVGAPGTVLGLPLPGALGRAMRDGTLLPGVGAMLGKQTFAEWLQSPANVRLAQRSITYGEQL